MWGIPSMLRSANSCNRCDMPVNVIAISKSQARKIALVCCYLINLSYPLSSPKSKIFIHSISQFPFPQSCFGYALILILIIKVMWILLLSSTWFSSQDVSCCVIFRGFFDKSDLYHNLAPPWFENPTTNACFSLNWNLSERRLPKRADTHVRYMMCGRSSWPQ